MFGNNSQTGGNLYDQGGYGCVFLPTLRCESTSEQVKGDATMNFIDKLMDKDNADVEFTLAQRVRRIPLWKNYFIIPESTCTPAPAEQQSEQQLYMCDLIDDQPLKSFRILRMPFGGTPLSQAYIRMNKDGNGLYDFIIHLFEASALLQMFGIVHRDIHQGNILVDSTGVPRLIDFNLSIDIRSPIQQMELLHGIGYNLFQEPPDSCLINAVAQGKDGFHVIDAFFAERKSLRKIQSLLGVSLQAMREQFEDFYRHSRVAQGGNIVQWFKTYWPTIDSWAIGINIIYILTDHMLWPRFVHGDYQTYKDRLLPILKDMVHFNPAKRIDCVQALARLDTDNYVIRKYGKSWLAKREK
jgi:serine/threonine protein kinase